MKYLFGTLNFNYLFHYSYSPIERQASAVSCSISTFSLGFRELFSRIRSASLISSKIHQFDQSFLSNLTTIQIIQQRFTLNTLFFHRFKQSSETILTKVCLFFSFINILDRTTLLLFGKERNIYNNQIKGRAEWKERDTLHVFFLDRDRKCSITYINIIVRPLQRYAVLLVLNDLIFISTSV